MFQGRLKTTLFDSGKLRDVDFDEAIAQKEISPLLYSLEPRLELEQRNQLFDHFVPYLFYHGGWSGAGAPVNPFYVSNGAGHTYFGFVFPSTYTSEPTYTEYSGVPSRYDLIHIMPGYVDGTAGAKWFIRDQIDPWYVWSDPSGQERLYFRQRWLWLPSQAVSSNINSLDIYFIDRADEVDGYDSYKSRSGRVRFKDNGGTPVTINKTSAQVLLLEYTWSILSV